MHWRMELHIAVTFLLGWLILSASAVGAERQLRWKFKEGDRYKVQVTQKQIHETRTNKRRTVNIDMTMEMDWTIDSVREGMAIMSQSFTRLAFIMETDGEKLAYDSSETKKPRGIAREVASRISPLIGARFELVMTDRGKIDRVKLSPEAQEAIEQSSAGSKLSDLFTPKGITKMLMQSAPALPEKPVNEEDTWTATTQTTSPLGTLKQSHTYTYAGTEEFEGRVLDKITMDTELTLQKSAGAGPRVKLTSQSLTGTFRFDAEAGRFESTTVQQRLSSETPYGDMVIKAKVESTSTLNITPTSAVDEQGAVVERKAVDE